MLDTNSLERVGSNKLEQNNLNPADKWIDFGSFTTLRFIITQLQQLHPQFKRHLLVQWETRHLMLTFFLGASAKSNLSLQASSNSSKCTSVVCGIN